MQTKKNIYLSVRPYSILKYNLKGTIKNNKLKNTEKYILCVFSESTGKEKCNFNIFKHLSMLHFLKGKSQPLVY